MALDSLIWGPHYWFVLLTIALCYPLTPNDVTKKKYYEFIQNLPLFIPDEKIGNKFSELLDKYPITPYLDSRESFIKWVHFIHNRINIMTDKDEISLTEALNAYYVQYKPKAVRIREEMKSRRKLIYFSLLIAMILLGLYLYKH